MAKFEIAEAITGRNEGGYANNPNDRGGETYAGIARNHWPNWHGWLIVDAIKKEIGNGYLASQINREAKKNSHLTALISQFYKRNFWDVNKLDLFLDQQIANSVFDFSVNSGTGRAAKFLQNVLGVIEDGQIGAKTIASLNDGNAKTIHIAYNCKRKAFYEGLAENSTQARFLNSWLSRLKEYV